MNGEEDGVKWIKGCIGRNKPCSAVLKWKEHDSFTFSRLQQDNQDSEMGGV